MEFLNDAMHAEIERLTAELADARGHIRSLTRGGKAAANAAWMLRQIVKGAGAGADALAREMSDRYEDTGFPTAINDALAWIGQDSK